MNMGGCLILRNLLRLGGIDVKYSNYLSSEFCDRLYNIIDVDEVYNEVLELLDEEVESQLISQCTESCDLYRKYRQ